MSSTEIEFRQGFSPEGYAAELRHKLGLGLGPVDLGKVCTKLDIDLTEDDLGRSGRIAGCLVAEGNFVEILVNKNIDNQGRRRFTIAHELGHWAIPSHRDERYECWSFDIDGFQSDKKLEVEANRFASEFLLPTTEAAQILKRKEINLALVKQIAEAFGMSVTATAIKMVKLTNYDMCAAVLLEDDKTIWVVGSPSFNRHWEVRTRGILTDWLEYEGKKRHLSRDWLSGSRITDYPYITVESLPIKSIARVLSIITVPVDEDDFDEDEEY